MLVMALHGHHRKHHTVFLDLLYGQTCLLHHVRPAALEKPDVVRMVDDSHLVRLVVPYIKFKFRFHTLTFSRLRWRL